MQILNDQILANYTTIQIGGCVQYMFLPTTEVEIMEAVVWCQSKSLPFMFLAGGSNTVFPDQNLVYSQVIINLTKFNEIVVGYNLDNLENNLTTSFKITAKAGASLQDIVDLSLQNYSNPISEYFSGSMVGLNRVPGTIGGATVGNAGAYGTEIKDIVESVKCIDFSNPSDILIFSNADCQFGYRDSIFKQNKNLVVLEITLNLPISQNKNDDKLRYQEIATKRDAIYPIGFASPGSLFKNILFDSLPLAVQSKIPNDWVVYGNKLPVGKLLESLDCKGFSVGGIQMRLSHSNIMVNFNTGSYQDACSVVAQLQSKIYSEYQIKLEPEVRFIPNNFNNFYK